MTYRLLVLRKTSCIRSHVYTPLKSDCVAFPSKIILIDFCSARITYMLWLQWHWWLLGIAQASVQAKMKYVSPLLFYWHLLQDMSTPGYTSPILAKQSKFYILCVMCIQSEGWVAPRLQVLALMLQLRAIAQLKIQFRYTISELKHECGLQMSISLLYAQLPFQAHQPQVPMPPLKGPVIFSANTPAYHMPTKVLVHLQERTVSAV